MLGSGVPLVTGNPSNFSNVGRPCAGLMDLVEAQTSFFPPAPVLIRACEGMIIQTVDPLEVEQRESKVQKERRLGHGIAESKRMRI
jgi:hypothetical protein